MEPLALATCTLPQVKTSPTYYYRKKVTISVGSSMQLTAVVGVRCDDGAVLYINGQEVGRRNMPTGAIGHSTMAATGYVRPLPSPTHGTTVPLLLHPSVWPGARPRLPHTLCCNVQAPDLRCILVRSAVLHPLGGPGAG
jgi:hypothetical protein